MQILDARGREPKTLAGLLLLVGNVTLKQILGPQSFPHQLPRDPVDGLFKVDKYEMKIHPYQRMLF